MMVSLQWNNLTRDRLFYGKYRFRAIFQLRGIARTRVAHDYTEYYERYLSLLDEHQRILLKGAVITPSWYAQLPKELELPDIERFIAWRNSNQDLVSLRLEDKHCSVFSNDKHKLEELSKVLHITQVEYTQAVNQSPPDTLTSRHPRHQFRTYLKEKRLTDAEINDLNNFIDKYTAFKRVEASQALARWLNQPTSRWRSTRTRSDFYFEHDDDGMPLILSLTLPNLLRKTYRLESRAIGINT